MWGDIPPTDTKPHCAGAHGQGRGPMAGLIRRQKQYALALSKSPRVAAGDAEPGPSRPVGSPARSDTSSPPAARSQHQRERRWARTGVGWRSGRPRCRQLVMLVFDRAIRPDSTNKPGRVSSDIPSSNSGSPGYAITRTFRLKVVIGPAKRLGAYSINPVKDNRL